LRTDDLSAAGIAALAGRIAEHATQEATASAELP